MARNEALLRLHKTLVARRDELRERFNRDQFLETHSRAGESLGDAADMAFDTGSDEVNSQLAQLESRELAQIDQAIRKLKQGSYGTCEGCSKKIPVARLNALPFSTMCIECQRELEEYGSLEGRGVKGDWGKVDDSFAMDEKSVSISELEMDISK
ncbi:MAG: TraR/DksA family transcriptional regulator [Planctomycetota bacterium]|jgi:DnaK suppressor protein